MKTNIRLRPIEPQDIPLMFAHQSDPESIRMAVVYPRDRPAFDAHWQMIMQDPGITARAIIANDVMVGQVSCFKMDGVDSVGYWIAREHWGKGYATRGLALLLEEVNTRPLHARVARQNTGSIRVLERNGFTLTRYQISPANGRFPVCEEAMMQLN